MKKETSILLVDDHPLFRQGLLNLLEKEKKVKVVGEANDGKIAIDMVRKLSPDIVVMDISMPKIDGIEATRQILSEFPDTKVVALSVHSEKQFVRGMLEAGAIGYILKESASKEIVEGLRTVLAGNVYLSRSISGIVVSDYSRLLSEADDITESAFEPILRTKLHRPPVTADIIPRARLVKQLEEGRTRAMTLISAPAGYGKTILASQWLEACQCPSAWVSLDQGDDDLREFLTYFMAAVQSAFPTLILQTQPLLLAADMPPVKVLVRYMLNDFDRVKKSFILVLDDYHYIQKEAINDLLTELLRHPSPILHLVLLTRRDPPLPFSNLRTYNQLTEIGIRDLRFTVEETTSFLERFLRVPIDEDTLSVLEDKVEGWVTGLRLAALSMHQKEDHEPILQGLKESTHSIEEYLIKEVLSYVPTAFARYLIEISIMDRFCAPLCDVLHSVSGEQKEAGDSLTGVDFIDWLEKTHLFVISLDNERKWFRYHHLFQNILQSQLKRRRSSEEIATFHSLASEWLESQGLIEESIYHALAAGDVIGAAQLAEQNREAILGAEKWYLFEKWLTMFPETVIQQRPGLLMARVWVLYHNYNIPAIPSIIDAVEALIGDAPTEQTIRAEIDFFRGYILYFQNEGSSSLKHLQDALKRIPETSQGIKSEIEILYGLARQMQGQEEGAINVLNEWLYHIPPPQILIKTRLLSTLVFIHIISGDLNKAFVVNQQLLDLATQDKHPLVRTWSVYLQGLIHFYRNELEIAIDYFAKAIEQKYVLHRRAVVDSMAGLAISYQAHRQSDRASTTMQHLFEYVDSLNDPAYSMLAHSCHARLSIMQGELTSATGWLQGGPPPVANMIWWLEIPCVTHCRALLAEGSEESLEKAEARLQEFLQFNQDNHNTCQMIHILTLLAVVYQKQAKTAEALATLEQAVRMARPGAFLRPFLELGPPMVDMLKHLLKQNVAEDYIEQILAVFKSDEQRAVQDLSGRQAAPSPSQQSGPFFESLTHRELEVLTYLAEGLSNKEIAAKLFLSSLTIKKHCYNIYQKLDVHTRIAALNKARDLGLLPRS